MGWRVLHVVLGIEMLSDVLLFENCGGRRAVAVSVVHLELEKSACYMRYEIANF